MPLCDGFRSCPAQGAAEPRRRQRRKAAAKRRTRSFVNFAGRSPARGCPWGRGQFSKRRVLAATAGRRKNSMQGAVAVRVWRTCLRHRGIHRRRDERHFSGKASFNTLNPSDDIRTPKFVRNAKSPRRNARSPETPVSRPSARRASRRKSWLKGQGDHRLSSEQAVPGPRASQVEVPDDGRRRCKAIR